jgi:hypothetical protein
MFGYLLAMHTCHAKLRYFDGTGSPREGQKFADDGYINAKMRVLEIS